MREILNLFPSFAFVARGVGAGYKAVTKWAERDSIPAKYDFPLVKLAEAEGIPLTLEQIAAARAGEAQGRDGAGAERVGAGGMQTEGAAP
jgi:hypothetical protein